MVKAIVFGFLAGVMAVVVFHQGAAFLLYRFGGNSSFVLDLVGLTQAPFNLAPRAPFGVPTVVSQAFWGGVWGVVLAALLVLTRLPALLSGLVFGALALTFVSVTVVAHLKGLVVWNGEIPWRGLLYNGAWGWGTALFLLQPLDLQA